MKKRYLPLTGAIAILLSFLACTHSLSTRSITSSKDGVVAETPADPNAAAEDPAWSNWMRDATNCVPFSSLTSSEYSDLEFLKNLIGDRRIVMLGENGH